MMVGSPQASQVSQIPSPGPGVPGARVGATSHVQRLRLTSGAGTAPERLGALIVTVTEGSSYDPIFQQVEQTDDQGLRTGDVIDEKGRNCQGFSSPRRSYSQSWRKYSCDGMGFMDVGVAEWLGFSKI